MDKKELVLDNGTTLKYKHCPATIIFQVFDQLRDGEYTSYNFCYYARIDGKFTVLMVTGMKLVSLIIAVI